VVVERNPTRSTRTAYRPSLGASNENVPESWANRIITTRPLESSRATMAPGTAAPSALAMTRPPTVCALATCAASRAAQASAQVTLQRATEPLIALDGQEAN